ncbi:MAG: hypothetical protein IKP73_05095 [Bacteroidales bacterium]|nr:hypothetical protein [Bacteroidales bacterium]
MKYQVYITSTFSEKYKNSIPTEIGDFLEANKELSNTDITTIPYKGNICRKVTRRRYNLWFLTENHNDITIYIPRAIEDRSAGNFFNKFSRNELEKDFQLNEKEKEEIANYFNELEPKKKEKLRPDMEIFEGIRDFSDSSTSFVYEMYDWTVNINNADIRDSYSAIFKSLKEIILKNGKEDREKDGWKIKGLNDDSNLQIIYRINYGINSKYFFLYNIVKDKDVAFTLQKLKNYTDKSIETYIKNADGNLSDDYKKLFAEYVEFGDDNLKKQAQKGYPDLIMNGDQKNWKKIENDEDANLALSEEEIRVLQETHYPCFINGLAGSGKTTILYYLFVNAFLYQISLPKSRQKKMIFLSQSGKLIDSARTIVTALGTTNYKRWTTRDSQEGEMKIKNGLKECFKPFKNFLRDNYLADEVQNNQFTDEKYIDYKLFAEKFAKWPLSGKKISPEKVWAVIRSFIKGKDYKCTFTAENYDNLVSEDDKIVDTDEYKVIYEIYDKYYSKLRNENYWDDLDMVSHILKKIEYNNPYNQFDVLFCDEAQDFTPIEILLILKTSKYYNYNLSNFQTIPIAFAGDPNQTISPTGFNWSRMKDIFTNSFKEQIGGYIRLTDVTLNNNYRSKSNIIRLSNTIQYLRGIFTRNNNLEPQNEWNVTENPIPGFIEITDSRKKIIDSVLKNVDFIITGDDGYEVVEDEILAQQDEDLLYTAASSKGLEANTVILYKFANSMREDCFTKIFENRELNSDDIFACEYFITKLYVAVTRAREILYIVDTADNYKKFWKYFNFIQNTFIKTRLENDNKREIWASKVGGIEIPQESELENNGGESTVEKRIRELSNRSVIAERIFNNAKYEKDIPLMKRARGYFSLCKADDRVKECEAYICRYENKYEKSGDIFIELPRKKEDAIKSYWIGQCWQKLMEYAEGDRRIFAKYCLNIIDLIKLISTLSENDKDWINRYKFNMSDTTWIFITDKIRKDALNKYGTNDIVLDFIENKLLKECGLSYLGDSIAELYYNRKQYADAVIRWENVKGTEYIKHYYTAQKELATEKQDHNEIIKWANLLEETEFIANKYGNTVYKLKPQSKAIVFRSLLTKDYLAALNYEWDDEQKYNELYYEDKKKFLEYYVLSNFTSEKYYIWVEDKVKKDDDLELFNGEIDQNIFTKIFTIEDDWMLFFNLRDNNNNRLFFNKKNIDSIIKSLTKDILPFKVNKNMDQNIQLALCLLDAIFGDYYNPQIADENTNTIYSIINNINIDREYFDTNSDGYYFNKCNIQNNISIIKKNIYNFISRLFSKDIPEYFFKKYCIFYETILNNYKEIINFYNNSIPEINNKKNENFINIRALFFYALDSNKADELSVLLIDEKTKVNLLSTLNRDNIIDFIELIVKDEQIADNEVYTIANVIYKIHKNRKLNYQKKTTKEALNIFVNRNIEKELKEENLNETLIKLLCYVGETVMDSAISAHLYDYLIRRNNISSELRTYLKQRALNRYANFNEQQFEDKKKEYNIFDSKKIEYYKENNYPKIFVPNSTRNDNKDIIENKLPQLSEEEQSILSKKDELKKAKKMVLDSYDTEEIEEETGLSKNIIKALKMLKRGNDKSEIAKATKFSEEFIKRL